MTTRKKLIKWVTSRTKDYENVEIRNLTTSFRDGMAFCALVHSIDSSVFNYDELTPSEPEKNLKLAFDCAEKNLGIIRLLDVKDVLDDPDSKTITIYLLEFVKKYPTNEKKKKVAAYPLDDDNNGDIELPFSQDEINRMIEKKKEERRRKRIEQGQKKVSAPGEKKEYSAASTNEEEEGKEKEKKVILVRRVDLKDGIEEKSAMKYAKIASEVEEGSCSNCVIL